MPISQNWSPDSNTATINISGRFDFAIQRDFREAYRSVPTAAQYVLDFGQVDYLDSSALGMLLLLREHAGGDSAKVSLIKVSPGIKKILSIANFEKMFSIS
ncbi:MAG: STAS domain-containing protein [bacterium]